WIVFDRDSRVDDFGKAALRTGAVFASTPEFHDGISAPVPSGASRLAETTAMFPASLPAIKAATDEPSSLIVARDVVPSTGTGGDEIELPVATAPRRGRFIALTAA